MQSSQARHQELASLFESYYLGWDRAGRGLPSRPPSVADDAAKKMYASGYRTRVKKGLQL